MSSVWEDIVNDPEFKSMCERTLNAPFRETCRSLGDDIERADPERTVVFQDLMRRAVDLVGLKAVSDAVDLAPGLIRRYAQKLSAPHWMMRKSVYKPLVKLLESRDVQPRTDEDRAEEIRLEEQAKIPHVGW